MIILAVKTDQSPASLALYQDSQELGSVKWEAHRTLANNLHTQLLKLLNSLSNFNRASNSRQYSLSDIEGIICFKGPGSFTGLRIGLSVANALAYSFDIPIVTNTGKRWLKEGIQNLQDGKNESLALPEYGRPANITLPRK